MSVQTNSDEPAGYSKLRRSISDAATKLLLPEELWPKRRASGGSFSSPLLEAREVDLAKPLNFFIAIILVWETCRCDTSRIHRPATRHDHQWPVLCPYLPGSRRQQAELLQRRDVHPHSIASRVTDHDRTVQALLACQVPPPRWTPPK